MQDFINYYSNEAQEVKLNDNEAKMEKNLTARRVNGKLEVRLLYAIKPSFIASFLIQS